MASEPTDRQTRSRLLCKPNFVIKRQRKDLYLVK